MPDISVYFSLFLKFLWLFNGYFKNIKFTLGAGYFWTFCDFLMDIFGYFENIKFTLEAEVLSTFCSCCYWHLPTLFTVWWANGMWGKVIIPFTWSLNLILIYWNNLKLKPEVYSKNTLKGVQEEYLNWGKIQVYSINEWEVTVDGLFTRIKFAQFVCKHSLLSFDVKCSQELSKIKKKILF